MPHALSDQRFLAARSLIVEIAAALDRAERHAAERFESLAIDPRWQLLKAAVDRLAAGDGRAEAIQLMFSDAYDPDWRRDGGPTLAGSPNCCGQ